MSYSKREFHRLVESIAESKPVRDIAFGERPCRQCALAIKALDYVAEQMCDADEISNVTLQIRKIQDFCRASIADMKGEYK